MNNTAGALTALGLLAAVITTLFWMVVAWRAMRAHERLAEALQDMARRTRDSQPPHG